MKRKAFRCFTNKAIPLLRAGGSFFFEFLADRDGALPTVADQPLLGEGTVLFDVDEVPAAERHHIDVVVARKPVRKADALVFHRIVVHVVVSDEYAPGAAELHHSLEHFVIHI